MSNQTNLLNDSDINSTFNGDLKSFVTIISITTSSFSLLGCSFVIFIYIAFQVLQQFNFKLVFYLSCSLLISNIGNLIVTNNKPNEINHNYCVLQGFFINFGELSSVSWTMIICYYMKNLLKYSDSSYKIRNWTCFLIGFAIPLVLSFIPLALDAYGYKNYICWINYENNDIEIFLIFLEFYAPLWMAFICFFITLCYALKRDQTSINPKQLKKFYMIRMYPLSLLICWIWGSFDIISQSAGSDYSILKIFHVFFGGIQGFINSIFFFNTIEVKYIIKTQLCGMLPCFYSRKNHYKQKLQDDPNESKEENTEEKKPHGHELVDV